MWTKFSVVTTKCIFKASLIGSLFLMLMIHVTCIFVEYQTGVIADHNLEVITWPVIFSNKIFTATVQIYFQGTSEWLLRFKPIKLEQLQITSLKQSRDYSKTINIWEENFHCHHPNVFQIFSEWVIGFKTCDTRYPHFWQISH